MHESVIAQSIVNSVLKHARQQAVSEVEIIFLKIGELTFLNPEQLLFWLQTGFKNTAAQQADIRIEHINAEICCSACGYHGDLHVFDQNEGGHYQVPVFICPACNASAVEILHGREMFIEKIQVKR